MINSRTPFKTAFKTASLTDYIMIRSLPYSMANFLSVVHRKSWVSHLRRCQSPGATKDNAVWSARHLLRNMSSNSCTCCQPRRASVTTSSLELEPQRTWDASTLIFRWVANFHLLSGSIRGVKLASLNIVLRYKLFEGSRRCRVHTAVALCSTGPRMVRHWSDCLANQIGVCFH